MRPALNGATYVPVAVPGMQMLLLVPSIMVVNADMVGLNHPDVSENGPFWSETAGAEIRAESVLASAKVWPVVASTPVTVVGALPQVVQSVEPVNILLVRVKVWSPPAFVCPS